ncbi:ABC transporter substrate-binding protein [Nesterenkonia jeotgali]|uniref:Glycine/betaine ABC transporter n=1 Tax=Nesterenkonia jeotgali TaxID=317018 RepID=A0A0W8IFQ3_9MICC|nr:ABC transporter substrate-binding protein [Nesterenkonia jeotgali]KUG58710.1 glycine/betaine ABC transporter [Nesterenkonia jeotgali]MBA8921509.1 osmoprotectant transport system substrate-binding protein [Nesterenkonia jeotgali]
MRTTGLWVTGTIAALALTGCGGGDPLAEDGESEAEQGEALVIGSQQYYSNTIIAELYAQALEAEDIEVEREFEIGQREVYVSEIESGAIDIFPEYAGNFLQYYDAEAEAATLEEITAALEEALPEGLRVLEPAEATDQDSFVVTSEFAEENDLTEVADLAGIEDLRIAANSEFETRPYGPDGLQDVYGVEISVVTVQDSGGPLTVDALLSGDVEVADIYSADPVIEAEDLVVLEDPEELVLPQNVLPVVSERVDDAAAAVLDEVNAALTSEELISLNSQSVDEQADPADVAAEWLSEQGLD